MVDGFSSEPPERLLRSTIRAIRPVVASSPVMMNQIAEDLVANLHRVFPEMVPENKALTEEGRLFSKLGYNRLDIALSREMLADIRAWFAIRPVIYEDENHKPLGTGLPTDAPDTAFVGYHRTSDVISCPHLIDIANDPRILNLVRGFLGFEPIIDTYLCWHSYPGRKIAGSPQTLHRDKDCFRFCKLFIYLSDVDDNSGPHVFLPNSHNPARFEQLYRSCTQENSNPLQFFVGGQRDSAQYLERVFAGKFERFTGAAGTGFLVNTYGLHKGEPPRTTTRMLFQVLYTLLPYGDVMGAATEKVPLTQLPVNTDTNRRFMYRNQLYIKA